jgi:endonuclease-3 related protein
MAHSLTVRLTRLYHTLYCHYGPQHWWPARSRFEIILGAILTQNTNWKNVEKAIAALRKEGLLAPDKLREVSSPELAQLVKPSGYYNIKAERIRSFLSFLDTEFHGNLASMFRETTETLRRRLLGVAGIGPETADSILLYAAKRPVFVIDTYTRRILSRHGLADGSDAYGQLQALFMNHLQPDVQMFNEYHALLVQVGKNHCLPRPRCGKCPVQQAEGRPSQENCQ